MFHELGPQKFAPFTQGVKRAAIAGLAALAAIGVDAARAHPHTFVEARVSLDFDDRRTVGRVTLSLTLDELTTSVLVEGLDANGNGAFDREELRDLAKENAASLSEFNYFTELRAADGLVPVSGLADYDYRYEDGRLILILGLDLERRIDPMLEAVTLRLYDPTYYVMVEVPAKGAVTFAGLSPDMCVAAIAKPDLENGSMTLNEAMFETEDPGLDSIGRDYADVITVACPPTR